MKKYANLSCVIIGYDGYLSQQLVFKNKRQIKFKEYKKTNFSYNNRNCKNINLLLNFASPNEVKCRKSKNIQKLFDLWKREFENALEICRPKVIINIASVHVFSTMFNKTAIHEKCLIGSEDQYAKVQIMCLNYLKEKNIKIINLFVSNVFGTINKKLKPRNDLILNKIINGAVNKEDIVLDTDCNTYRDFIWIEDFLFILNKIISSYSKIKNSNYIIASGHPIKINLACKKLFDKLKISKEQKISFGKKKQVSKKVIYNNSKITKDFRIKKFHKVNDCLEKLKTIYN